MINEKYRKQIQGLFTEEELNAPLITKDEVKKMIFSALCLSVILFVFAEIAVQTGVSTVCTRPDGVGSCAKSHTYTMNRV